MKSIIEDINDIDRDKTRNAFRVDSPLGSNWFIKIDGVERSLKYIGKTQGKYIFKFTIKNPSDTNWMTNVMILAPLLVYKYRRNSKR